MLTREDCPRDLMPDEIPISFTPSAMDTLLEMSAEQEKDWEPILWTLGIIPEGAVN